MRAADTFYKISKLFKKASPSVHIEVVRTILIAQKLKRRRTPLKKYVVWALRLKSSCEEKIAGNPRNV